MMEVLRTALGFAGARDPAKRIHSPEALVQYQRLAVNLVRICLMRRRHGGVRARKGSQTLGYSCALTGPAFEPLRVDRWLCCWSRWRWRSRVRRGGTGAWLPRPTRRGESSRRRDRESATFRN